MLVWEVKVRETVQQPSFNAFMVFMWDGEQFRDFEIELNLKNAQCIYNSSWHYWYLKVVQRRILNQYVFYIHIAPIF